MKKETQKGILENAPDNWGRWGDDDEIGTINYLTPEAVLRGIDSVSDGEVFTLGIPIGRKDDDPVWPSRSGSQHFMNQDHGHYLSGKVEHNIGTVEVADDVIHMFSHGTTHVDALGHGWYDGKLYNGFDQETTMGGLDHGSIEPIAEHGIIGRGVLLDIAGYRDVDALDAGERITLEELHDCADAQNTDLAKADVLIVRTGWLELFYDEGPDTIYNDPYNEPGITYTDELIQLFHENEIAMYCTDTMANEQTYSETTETYLPLHPGFLRDMGMPLNELCLLDEIAADCAEDGQYEFLFVGAPLKIVGGTGSPINPIAIK
jgi:kynurenine formamidase